MLVSNRLVVDGVLRSDNRSNESVFSLHYAANDETAELGGCRPVAAEFAFGLARAI
ncbi:MAG: hypothetical protein R3B96_17070 [Pirellulaceae bacterium]